MVKHTENICRLLLTNCLSGLICGLKGLCVTITQLSLKKGIFLSFHNKSETDKSPWGQSQIICSWSLSIRLMRLRRVIGIRASTKVTYRFHETQHKRKIYHQRVSREQFAIIMCKKPTMLFPADINLFKAIVSKVEHLLMC